MKKINNTYTCKNCVFFDEETKGNKLFFEIDEKILSMLDKKPEFPHHNNYGSIIEIGRNVKMYIKFIGKKPYKGVNYYCHESSLYIDYFPEIDKIYIPYIGKICEKFKYDFYKNIRKILDERR